MRPLDFNAGGAPHRDPAVLLHSSASSSRQWSALAEQLAPHFDVRTVDFHGHGAQPAWRGESRLTLADEVALIEPILREAGRVHLIGHSYGGAVALKAARMYPHAVRTLVVYEPVLFGWLFDADGDSGAAREVLALSEALKHNVALGRHYAAAASFIDYWSGAGVWESMDPVRRYAIAARIAAVGSQFDALSDERLPRAAVPGSAAPTLYMTGTQTPASTRRIAQLARAVLPNANHVTLADMGHMGPITHAAKVNRRIHAFLFEAAEVSAAGGAQRRSLATH